MNYYIKIPHFYSFEYHEGEKMITIELDFREEILYLTTTMIKHWDSPYDAVEIDNSEKLRILKNIRECLLERWKPEEVIIVN